MLTCLNIQYIYQVLLNGCRLGFYEPIRSNLTSAVYGDSKVQSLGANVFSGAASGVIGAASGSPFFLVKTRLQSYSPFLPVGTQHNYKNMFDGLGKIYSNEGIKGIYRGVGAAMIRTSFGSSVQLPTYFFAKRFLTRHMGVQEGPSLHLASSAASGFVVCCFMHPPGKYSPSLLFLLEFQSPGIANLSFFRHHYVSYVQPDWQPLPGRVRLLA